MKIFNVFPNPVFIENCPFQEDVKNFVNQELKSGNLTVNENCPNLHHLDNDLKKSILSKDNFKDFNEWLVKCANYYVTDVLGYELVDGMTITDSWLNICNKNGMQVPHYHTNSYISGTYYVNIEDGHSPLTFRHIDNSTHSNNQSISLGIGKSATLYNSDAVFFPENGQLFLWQSHLTHGYFNNQSDNRISLSMNFLPKIIANHRYAFKIVPHE